MATKTITIMEDAYEILKRRKKEGESFSEVIRDMAEKAGSKGSIMDSFGILKNIPQKEFDQMKKDIEHLRRPESLKRLIEKTTPRGGWQ